MTNSQRGVAAIILVITVASIGNRYSGESLFFLTLVIAVLAAMLFGSDRGD